MNTAEIHDVGAAYCNPYSAIGFKMEYLLNSIIGTPIWMWAVFLIFVFSLLILDLGFFNNKSSVMTISKSFKMSAFYIAMGLLFALFVWRQIGSESALLYITGFVVEKSLAIDNVFVIAMIFTYFNVPTQLQHRVLFWGILGVLILRAIMIGFGAVIVEKYEWVLYIFAAFLVFTGIKMLNTKGDSHDLKDNKMLAAIEKHLPFTKSFDGFKILHQSNF